MAFYICTMIKNLDASWKKILKEEFKKKYFKKLTYFVTESYKEKICYPSQNEMFSAFNNCSFNAIKVVIIGQDPYHGKGQANGLCFSVHNGIAHPPSLKNILKELSSDLNTMYPVSGDLTHWAKQGVLLLNATLTVAEKQAGSHQKQGWETFTDAVIRNISDKKQRVVFLLWGGFAKKKKKLINTEKHFILEIGHPSPLSANRGFWFGNQHFSKTNAVLKENDEIEIDWLL